MATTIPGKRKTVEQYPDDTRPTGTHLKLAPEENGLGPQPEGNVNDA